MLTLKNTRMQPQAKQCPPGASKARHIPYGGSSAQLTQSSLQAGRAASALLSHLLPAVFAMQFGDQGLMGKAHILNFPIDNVKLCVRSHHHSRGRDRMLSKLTEPLAHGQPSYRVSSVNKQTKSKTTHPQQQQHAVWGLHGYLTILF